MAKPELGTKRVCPTTGRKFYDLNQDPVISPYTGEVVPVAPLPTARRAEPAAASPRAPVGKTEDELPETADVELVSLEDADAESQGSKKPDAADDDDIDIEETEEAPFIEEEEGDDDVTDIIGDGHEDEEDN